MIALSGADIVLPDRVLSNHSILISGGLIEAIAPADTDARSGVDVVDLSGHVIAPGFIDVHVHGVEGCDVLEDADAVGRVAARLPRFGVTAFCPTSVACTPGRLKMLLLAVTAAGESALPAARVLGAHLESNFINPEWKGAQPPTCLRLPFTSDGEGFSGADILRVIRDHRAAVAIVTMAPELPNGIALVRELVALGIRVSIGHSGATYEHATAAIEAGARHATHLFNRMSSMTSRAPGVVGAVLESPLVTAEVICDGVHVHRALLTTAIRAKSIDRIVAITDGTAAAGLPPGSRAKLGDHTIIAGERTALLEDGTLAGSVLTMDGAFRMLIDLGHTLPEASRMCSTTAALALGADDTGAIAAGKRADLVIMSRDLRVKQTYVGGRIIS